MRRSAFPIVCMHIKYAKRFITYNQNYSATRKLREGQPLMNQIIENT